MIPAAFQLPTKIVCGPGRIADLGTLAAELRVDRVLVVSDPGIVAAGHTQPGVESLRTSHLEVRQFDGVEENPTTKHVQAGVAVAKEFQPDLIVGLGGGSSMDCAKGINFVYSCGGEMRDYWGVGKATGPLLPMIAVPTTAGTGSETQSYALISDAETHLKMACGDEQAAFRIAILDPDLTLTQPPRVTALTGIDATAHALESFVSKPRNWFSQGFSREAWRRLSENLPRVLRNPDDPEVRAQMQLGACLSGIAIENSMLGAAHALANPLTASYGISHGEAVGLMLPHVIRVNGKAVGADYATLVNELPGQRVSSSANTAVDRLANLVEEFGQQAGLAGKLSECGIDGDHLPELAAAAAEQWTGQFNPIKLAYDDYLQIYETAF
jgi:alcohol dehydrogenase